MDPASVRAKGGPDGAALRRTHRCGTASDLTDVARLHLAVLALSDVERDLLALVQGLEPLVLDLAEVNEQVVPILARDEAIALGRVEPLDGTFCHFTILFRPEGLLTKQRNHLPRTADFFCGDTNGHAANTRKIVGSVRCV